QPVADELEYLLTVHGRALYVGLGWHRAGILRRGRHVGGDEHRVPDHGDADAHDVEAAVADGPLVGRRPLPTGHDCAGRGRVDVAGVQDLAQSGVRPRPAGILHETGQVPVVDAGRGHLPAPVPG